MATKEQAKKVVAKPVTKAEKVVAAKKPEPKKEKAPAPKPVPATKTPVKGSNARANKMAKDAKADSKISEALKNVSARAMSEIKSINH